MGTSGERRRHFPVAVRCPVSTTITDRSTGRSFVLDQSTGEVDGDLALGFGLIPEGEHFGVVAVLPEGDLTVRIDPVASGRFSMTIYDPARPRAAAFEDVPVEPGDVLGLRLSPSGAPSVLRDASGRDRVPRVREVPAAEVERVRAAAVSDAIEQGGFFADPGTGTVHDRSAPAAGGRPGRAGWLTGVGLLLVGVGVAGLGGLTIAFLRREGWKPGRPVQVRGLEIAGRGAAASFVALTRRVTIGRLVDNDLVLSDPQVSGHHAEIAPAGGEATLRDLGSRNGTRVNGQAVSTALVRAGDRIEMGETLLVVR
jgi:hypothetical protein